MQAFGTYEGRRVVLEISGRDKALRMFDDDTGKEIERHPAGSEQELSVDGNSLRWGQRTVTLDRGEESSAKELLQSHIVDARPLNESTVDDISEDDLLREVCRQDVMAISARAATVSGIITALLVLFGVVAVVAGVLIANEAENTFSGTQYPHLATGVTLAVAGLVEMCVGLMLSLGVGAVAQYIRYRAEFDPTR